VVSVVFFSDKLGILTALSSVLVILPRQLPVHFASSEAALISPRYAAFHRMHEMQTVVTDVPMTFVSVSLSPCTLQKRLNRSRSCLGW